MNHAPLTTAESLAVAVMRGDWVAALALADLVHEQATQTLGPILPERRFTCDVDRVRVVVLVDASLGPDVLVDSDSVERHVREWLRGERLALTLVGISRVELYELPPPPEPMEAVIERDRQRWLDGGGARLSNVPASDAKAVRDG